MKKELFFPVGAHTLVDGQYGSTGKGVLAAWLALQAAKRNVSFAGVISNAGPNSGHTFYHEGRKIVLKQLPTFAVASMLLGRTYPIYLSAGAIIDPDILAKEAADYPGQIFIHPNAAVITLADKNLEHSGTVAAVAGTRSGTGAALARKVLRDPTVVYGRYSQVYGTPPNVRVLSDIIAWKDHRYFVEVSQGFSLGLNQPFYPKCTSRECTVSQAMSDAGLPPRAAVKTYMAIRTYPIRVGNVDGHSSGGWYPDQTEISWEDLGVEPELTTVTQRVRRVATFSALQLRDSVRANDPDFLFVNFLNYLAPGAVDPFVNRLQKLRTDIGARYRIIGGLGATSEDVRWLD